MPGLLPSARCASHLFERQLLHPVHPQTQVPNGIGRPDANQDGQQAIVGSIHLL